VENVIITVGGCLNSTPRDRWVFGSRYGEGGAGWKFVAAMVKGPALEVLRGSDVQST